MESRSSGQRSPQPRRPTRLPQRPTTPSSTPATIPSTPWRSSCDWFDYCGNAPAGFNNCANPTSTGVDFAFYVGGRYHINDHVALVMRIGYPTFSFGVSFM